MDRRKSITECVERGIRVLSIQWDWKATALEAEAYVEKVKECRRTGVIYGRVEEGRRGRPS